MIVISSSSGYRIQSCLSLHHHNIIHHTSYYIHLAFNSLSLLSTTSCPCWPSQGQSHHRLAKQVPLAQNTTTSLDKDTPFAFAFAPTVRKNRTVHIASFINLSPLGYSALSLPDTLSTSSQDSAWQSLHLLRRHLCCHCWNGMKAQYIAGWCTLGYHNMKMSSMVSP
jgi:hypothetical protein